MSNGLKLPVDILPLIPVAVVLLPSDRVNSCHCLGLGFNFIQCGMLPQWFHAPIFEEFGIIMDDAVPTTEGQCPLIIRIAWSPTAPLLKIITGPDILKCWIIFNPWVQVLEIAAASILECTRHCINACFLRLNHGLGLGTIASGARTKWDVDDLHINLGMDRLKHFFQMLNARNVRPTHWINAILVRFAQQ